MGTGWRRFTETIKQTTVIGSTLSPTSNDRNKAMLDEAAGFESHVKHLIAKINAVTAAHESLLKTTTEALRSNIPRVYHEIAHAPPPSPPGSPSTPSTPGGHLVKTEALTTLVPSSEATPIAADLEIERITGAEQATLSSVQNEVLLPLQAWLDAFTRLHAQKKEVEAVRLEVDSRRRTVADLTVKEASKQAAVQRNQDAKHTAALEEATALLKHKTDKLNATAARFNEAEASLHAELTALIQDTVHLRNYAANALRILGEGLVNLAQLVSGSVGDVPITPPAAAVESSPAPAVAGTVPAPAVVGSADDNTPRSAGAGVEPLGHLTEEGGLSAGESSGYAVGGTSEGTEGSYAAGNYAAGGAAPRFFGEGKQHGDGCEALSGGSHVTTPDHTGAQALSHIPGVEGPVRHEHSGREAAPESAGARVLDRIPGGTEEAVRHTGQEEYVSQGVKGLSLNIPA